MTVTADVLRRQMRGPVPEFLLAEYVREQPGMMDAIQQGLKEWHEGKVTPWSEVKTKLGWS